MSNSTFNTMSGFSVSFKTPKKAPLIGLDLGKFETRMALPAGCNGEAETVFRMPTMLGYSRVEAELFFSCVGERALERRDHLRLVNPLGSDSTTDGDVTEDERRSMLRDFAEHLREVYKGRYTSTPWAVVNRASGSSAEENATKRAIANELFERVLFADDALLLALGVIDEPFHPCSIIVDVGSNSTRAVLMYGEAPKPEHCAVVPFGGDDVDEVLRSKILERYPELLLTTPTLNQLTRQLAFVTPVERKALLKIRFQGHARALEISEIVNEACSTIVAPIMKVIQKVLGVCPSDEAERFLENIILVGGGGAIAGLPERVELELSRDGFQKPRVRTPENPTHLIARGAARWATMVPENQWTIPLFSFAGKEDELAS